MWTYHHQVHQIASKRLEIDAWVILFAWMLSFGPPESQDHITSQDLMSITTKTSPDQLETTRFALFATFYARREPLDFFPHHHMEHVIHQHHIQHQMHVWIKSRLPRSDSTLNLTPGTPLFGQHM